MVKKFFAGVLVLVTAFLVFSGGVAQAESKIWVNGDGFTKIGMLEKGQIYEGQIEVNNRGDEAREVELRSEPYTINQDDGFSKEFNKQTPRTVLADWVSFPDGSRYTLQPDETRSINYRVSVPNDAIMGSQSAAISIEGLKINASNNTENFNTEIEGQFMWLLFADINGDAIYQKGSVLDWDMDWLFLDNKPVTATTTIQNEGNLSFTAKTKIEFKDFFRGYTHYETEDGDTVLVDSKRVINQDWEKAPLIGVFNVTETVTMLDREEVFSKVVVIFPLWLLLIIIMMITLLVIALILKIRKHNDNKQSKKNKQTA